MIRAKLSTLDISFAFRPPSIRTVIDNTILNRHTIHTVGSYTDLYRQLTHPTVVMPRAFELKLNSNMNTI